MFKWIKVLSKLSKEDDVMASLDAKVKGISDRMETFGLESSKTLDALVKAKAEAGAEIDRLKKSAEEFKTLVDETEKRISAEKTDLAKVCGEMESYRDAVGQKVDEIQKTAQEHLDEVNAKVKAYDVHVTELGKEITRLGDSIAEFEKR